MTQCLGGYLSDRIGGELVLAAAAVIWAAATAVTPFIILSFHSTQGAIIVPVMLRVILGCAQGIKLNLSLTQLYLILYLFQLLYLITFLFESLCAKLLGNMITFTHLSLLIKSFFFSVFIAKKCFFKKFTGVHFPSISSVLAGSLPTEERAFGTAFSMAGNKLGCVVIWCCFFFVLGGIR